MENVSGSLQKGREEKYSIRDKIVGELYRQLEQYGESDYYPFHMPGHKRKREAADGKLAEIYGLDITEIEGFDNLHHPEGILQKEQERAAELYGAGRSYYLVNGSTCGILSAVFAVTKKGSRILMARNCHKSVYHAAYLRSLKISYLYPLYPFPAAGQDGMEFGIAGAVEPEMVERALQEQPDCAAVVITSPTYEGVVSDVEKIAYIAHSYGIPLIVDEAHGAHFGFHEGYPAGSAGLGADLVIHSVHKTLPSMTQTALLHWNRKENPERGRSEKGDADGRKYLTDRQELERYLRIFQTSSPSYVLMASISSCMDMVETEGWQRLDRLLKYRNGFVERIKQCCYIKILGAEKQDERDDAGPVVSCDPCKLVVGIANGKMTGQELYDILLKRYHLQMEMAAESYVLAIVTMMDGQEGWKRLGDALLQIDGELCRNGTAEKQKVKEGCADRGNKWNERKGSRMPVSEQVMTIAEAYDAEQEEINLTDAGGRIAAEFINLYPPGIPLVVPGERLEMEMIETLLYYDEIRFRVQGVKNGKVKVVKI